MVFLGLEIKHTVEERDTLRKAEEFATYGPQGKPGNLDLPDDWRIKISGIIAPKVKYKISVSYYSQSDSKLCEDWNPIQFSPSRTSTKLYWYTPEVKEGKHHIEIPLTEHDPESGCKYRVHDVMMNLLSADNEENLLSGGFFMLFYADWAKNKLNPPAYGFNYKQISDNIINIECVLPDPNNMHYSHSPCGLAPVRDHFTIAQPLPVYNSKYEVNINISSQDHYYNALFLTSQYYTNRVEFVKYKLKNARLNAAPFDTFNQLKIKLEKQHLALDHSLLEVDTVFKNATSAKTDAEKFFLQQMSVSIKSALDSLEKIRTIEAHFLQNKNNEVVVNALLPNELDEAFLQSSDDQLQIKFLMNIYKKAAYGSKPIGTVEKSLNNKHRMLKKHINYIIRLYESCNKCSQPLLESLKPIHKRLKQVEDNGLLSDILKIEAGLLINNP